MSSSAPLHHATRDDGNRNLRERLKESPASTAATATESCTTRLTRHGWAINIKRDLSSLRRERF